MRLVSFLLAISLVLLGLDPTARIRAAAQEEEEESSCMFVLPSRATAPEAELNSCPVSGGDLEDELEGAFHDATEVIINCISVDEADGVRNGVVSVFYMEINNASSTSSTTSARFSLECTGSLLKILPSERPATNATVSCAEECAVEEEQDNLCPTACDELCVRCYGSSADSCVECAYARLENGMCTDCVYGTKGSDGRCACKNDFSGENCTECSRSSVVLRNYDSPVPGFEQSNDSTVSCECYEETASEEREFVFEDARCESDCEPNYEPVGTEKVCYACGIEYCLECASGKCERCRAPLVPSNCTMKECITVEERECNEENVVCQLEKLREVAIKQCEENEEVEEEVERGRLALAISLPITCVAVIVVCVLLSVFAHFRYPHVNPKGNKRHRKRTVSSSSDIDKEVWRSRPSIKLR